MGFIQSEVMGNVSGSTVGDLREVINYLVQSKDVVRISPELLLSTAGLRQVAKIVLGHLSGSQTMTVAIARDILRSSRRFVVPILEYLDRVGITRREGDVRVRGAAEMEELE